MKINRVLLPTTAIILAFFLFVVFSRQESPDVNLDVININDTVKTLASEWESLRSGNGITDLKNNLDYVVIDNENNLIAATRYGLSENINEAIKNRDTIVDIVVDGVIAGKAIFYNDTLLILQRNRTSLIRMTILFFSVLSIIFVGFTFYLHFTLLRPFIKLERFARRIALGNLDIPLEMDRNNIFGAFTESFDLMREELHKARENERKANQSKKELVASLSHDIKTPVASIRAISEIMLIMTKDEEDKKQLEIIDAKAEQINSLVTNMFHATLEELNALTVTIEEIESGIISDLISNADYQGRVKPFSIPNCIILADSLRLQQVFDNIIVNSYKYAGTEIEIESMIEGQYLILDVADYGVGVAENELPFLFNKFFQGKDKGTKGGYGLGLYISKYIMAQMSGDIGCENRQNGFAVRLMLRLAG